MKKQFLIAVLFAASTVAFAHNGNDDSNPCGNNGNNCNPTPASGNTSNAGGDGQGTGTGIGVGIAGASAGSNATGGNADSSSNADTKVNTAVGQTLDSRNTTLSGSAAKNDANLKATTGAQKTTVDASDRSTNTSKWTAWAPVVHGPAAPALATANLVVVPNVCGPRVKIVATPVIGKRFGVWGGTDDVEQGVTDKIVPADEPFIRKGNYLMGHEFTALAAVVGTSSGGSFSIGGFGKDGDGGQGGGSATGGMQQIVMKVTVRDCVMAEEVSK